MARINEIIDGKYEILREIGRGGMSVVYLAMDRRLNRQWAVKEFKKDAQDENNKVNLESLMHEANIMKRLDHPTLPRIVDIIDENDSVYIIMDYIEGEPLSKVLEASGAQPQEAVVEWAKQLAEVLDYLHTQKPPVIYRDMKPSNIMLKPDNTIRLFDFGIAREYKEGKDGDTIALGTRGYAAPEQFGDSQTDARTDIYSFGVTLYHLLTGKNPSEPPYEIYPIRHWNPSLSSGLEWLIQKCTQLNPNDRYQSFAEVTYVLENLEKFEGAYKRKQRSRINLFITMAILTIVFTISSIGCLFGAAAEKSKSYEALCDRGTVNDYVDAIMSVDDELRAYDELADLLDRNTIAVYADDSKIEGQENDKNISVSTLNEAFSTEHLEIIKEQDLKKYAQINSTLGILYWEKYIDSSGIPTAGETFANDYFKNVIQSAIQLESENVEYAGLLKQRYNYVTACYMISFFSTNPAIFQVRKDGATYAVDDNVLRVANHAGIEGIRDDKTFENAYYSYWKTCNNLIEVLRNFNDSDISQEAKLESLEKLQYILQESHSSFKNSGGVTIEEINTFFENYNSVLASITSNEDDVTNLKNNMNTTINSINADYSSEIKKDASLKIEKID